MSFNGTTYVKYKFDEVPRAGGLISPLHVAWEANADYHVALTSNGIQEIKKDRASTWEHPYLYQFLQGNILEDYHGLQEGISSLNQIGQDTGCDECEWSSETQYPLTCLADDVEHPAQLRERKSINECLDVAINFVGSELIAFSYGGIGENEYEYVITWHEALGRFGKLKIQHSHITELPDRVGFHQMGIYYEGEVQSLQTKHDEDCEGVVILGRYQLERDHVTEVEHIELERIQSNKKLDVYWLHSTDGANWLQDTIPCNVILSDNMRTYKLRATGKTHALKLVGTFVLTSVILTFRNNGRR